MAEVNGVLAKNSCSIWGISLITYNTLYAVHPLWSSELSA